MKEEVQSFLEACPEPTLVIQQGFPLAWNSLTCRMLEWSSSKAGVDNVWLLDQGLFVLEGDEMGLLESKLERLAQGKAAKMRCTVARQTGSVFEGEWKAVPWKDGMVILQIRDISERMLYEQVIRESEKRFRSLARHAMEGIAFLEGTTIVDANEQFAILFGQKELPIGMDILTLVHTRDWQRLGARKYARSRVELQGTTAQGHTIHLEATRSTDATTNQTVLMVYDITERKRTELDLLQTKERFRMLVETSPIGLMLMVDGKIKYSNPGLLDLMGIRVEDDIYDLLFISLFHEDDQRVLEEDMAMVERGERPPYREVRLLDGGGDEVAVGIRMTLSFHDRSPAVQVTLTDLRTRVALMREQLRATLAEESNLLLKEEIKNHKATQRRLAKAEKFNRSIIESSIDMIVAFDAEGTLIQFNQAFAIEFGLETDCNPSDYDFTSFTADPDQIESVFDSLSENASYSGEAEAKRLNGETFPVLITLATLHLDDGEANGAMAVIRDITEAKQAQQELLASEERYRTILESANDVIFTIDDQGFFTYTNPSFNEILGHSEVELSKLTVHDIIPNLPKRGKTWMKALEGNREERQFRGVSGKMLTMLGGATIQTNDAGKPSGVRGIFLDITDMRLHEQRAKTQSAKLESIFDTTANLVMFTMDSSDHVNAYNKNFKYLFENEFGLDLEADKSFISAVSRVVDEEPYQGQLRLFMRAMAGKPQQFELPLKTIAGESRWYQVFLNPVSLGEGEQEISCIAYDITERKEIDRAIRSALKEKEVLLQEVHHRVKNNMQVISSMLNLQKSFVKDPETLMLLEESTNRIATMSFIHESLYRTSNFANISFAEYLQRLSANLVQSYSRSGCDVTLQTVFDEVFLSLDQAIPCGLITNELVTNALKYAFPNRECGVITVRLTHGDQGWVELEVADDGVGLPVGMNFAKNDSLGVYLVQALTEQIDGELVVTSTDQGKKGCSFLVRFTPTE
ncbi:MAG: PAS domain S-box protein [Bacteroidetes bacterium]|nr:PAS domain S-box protein [Bacteroidota bacterium]